MALEAGLVRGLCLCELPRRDAALKELVQLRVRPPLRLGEEEVDGGQVQEGDAAKEIADLRAPAGALVGQQQQRRVVEEDVAQVLDRGRDGGCLGADRGARDLD